MRTPNKSSDYNMFDMFKTKIEKKVERNIQASPSQEEINKLLSNSTDRLDTMVSEGMITPCVAKNTTDALSNFCAQNKSKSMSDFLKGLDETFTQELESATSSRFNGGYGY